MSIKQGRRIIPKSALFRYKFNVALLDAMPKILKTVMPKEEAQNILKEDRNSIFNWKEKSIGSLIGRNKFVSFNGKVKDFEGTLNASENRELLILLLLGKIQNDLKVPYNNPDLSTLMLLNRFNAFLERLSEVTGEDVRMVIATENTFIDKVVIKPRVSKAKKTLAQVRQLLGDFSLKRIRLEPLENFLPEGYYDAFDKALSDLGRKGGAVKKLRDFPSVYKMFVASYPTHSIEQALNMYTTESGFDDVKDWAFSASLRYIAFQKARYELLDFWGHNKEFIRSTVSSKPDSLVFKYGIGRVTPPHGVSTVFEGAVGTEYFIDVANAAFRRKGSIKMAYYRGMPFCVRLSGKLG